MLHELVEHAMDTLESLELSCTFNTLIEQSGSVQLIIRTCQSPPNIISMWHKVFMNLVIFGP